ncbi:MAG: 50S ribosomal protein L34e [Candidatus Heimdallarchaeota archaeon]
MPRVKKRTPTGKIIIKTKKKKPKIAKCAGCGKPLHGVPRLRPVELRKLAKTKKRPERPFGGYYCSRCAREIFKERARKIV